MSERTTGDELQPEPHDITDTPEDEPDRDPEHSGYSYTVVDDGSGVDEKPSGERRHGVHPLWLVVAAVIPAVIVGALVWFLAPDGDSSGGNRTEQNVSTVLDVFSQSDSEGVIVTRYEGEVPAGVPDLPKYDGAEIVSAVQQRLGENVAYILIYDTGDARDDVAGFFGEALDEDPWQISGGSSDRNATAHQFNRIDDPNVSGVVLVAGSKDGKRTTILESISVIGGGEDAAEPTYEAGAARTLPDGFPEDIPEFEGATLIETAFQKQAGGNQYLVSYISEAGPTEVVNAFRGQFEDQGYTIEELDPADVSNLERAEAFSFSHEGDGINGQLIAGVFPEDPGYTRIDIQLIAN